MVEFKKFPIMGGIRLVHRDVQRLNHREAVSPNPPDLSHEGYLHEHRGTEGLGGTRAHLGVAHIRCSSITPLTGGEVLPVVLPPSGHKTDFLTHGPVDGYVQDTTYKGAVILA